MSAEWIETHPGRWAARIGPFEACVVVRYPGGDETGYYDGDVYASETVEKKDSQKRVRRVSSNLGMVATNLNDAKLAAEAEAHRVADFVLRLSREVKPT